jgi:L-aspartate oxidase
MQETIKTEVLIVGSGIAGLTTALSLPSSISIFLATKSTLKEANTSLAQGGVASTFGKTVGIEAHVEDTLNAGMGICDKHAVEILVGEGVDRVADIVGYGVNFDRDHNNQYEYLREGAHSERRVLHVADRTGDAIERVLLNRIRERSNIKVGEYFFLKELRTDGAICNGAIFLHKKENRTIVLDSAITVIATGGAGQIYEKTSNPLIATGDGLAAAYRVGVSLRDMEFIQFHPTTFANPSKKRLARNFLISESVRGEGAQLLNDKGERFVYKHDKRGELAPRDRVSRAIFHEIEAGNSCYLNLSPIKGDISKKFPVIYRNCLKYGIDLKKEQLPIMPAAHYIMGGIVTDYFGRTACENLFSCGEASSVGVHGANRLASNALLEGLVFGYRVAQVIKGETLTRKQKILKVEEVAPVLSLYKVKNIKRMVQHLMYTHVGISRTGDGLAQAILELSTLKKKYEPSLISSSRIMDIEVLNILDVGLLVAQSAYFRKESRGGHYREDYIEMLEELTHSIVTKGNPKVMMQSVAE